MTFSCRFFSGEEDEYFQPDFAKLMRDSMGNGIVRSIGNEFEVIALDPAVMKVKVKTGRGYINGYSFDIETTPEELTIPASDATNPRIDRIIARLSETTNRNITLMVLTGTPSATPTAPELVRAGDTYDVSMAQVYVGAGVTSIIQANITDERYRSDTFGYAGERHSSQSTTTTLDYAPANQAIDPELQNLDPCSFDGLTWHKDETDPTGIFDGVNRVVITSGFMNGWSGLTPGRHPTANTIAVSETAVLVCPSVGHGLRKFSFTISYSDSPWAITYSDGSEELTEEQRRAVVCEHCRHAVVKNGAVNYYLDPSNLNKKADGTVATLTGADGDVMLVCDPMWWKVDYVAETTLKVTFAWYNFSDSAVTAHRYGDIICSKLGIGVFESVNTANAMRSINSSSAPSVNINEQAFYTASQLSGTSGHYNVELPMTRMMWDILLLFEHGTRDLQTKIGQGNVSTSAAVAVNNNWDALNAWNKGSQSATVGVTACGLHNPWGNVWEFLGEYIYRDGVSYMSEKGGSDHFNITLGLANKPASWVSVSGGTFTTSSAIKEVAGDNKLPFLPKTTGGSSATYYCDGAYQTASQDNCCLVGGNWVNGSLAGPFAWGVYDGVSYAGSYIGARLQVLME